MTLDTNDDELLAQLQQLHSRLDGENPYVRNLGVALGMYS